MSDIELPYRLTTAELVDIGRVDHFWHLKFDIAADWLSLLGLDQRIKIFIPSTQPPLTAKLVGREDWYAQWRESAELQAEGLRTLTIFNPQADGKFEVLIADHNPVGAIGRWLATAKLGDQLAMALPNAHSPETAVGIDWNPGAARKATVIVDDTALPALLGISQKLNGMQLRAYAAVSQIPTAIDKQLKANSVEVEYFIGSAAESSEKLLTALGIAREAELKDAELIWDTPDARNRESYFFVAGESSLVRSARRHLLQSINREDAAFLGYWKNGVAG